MWLDEHERKKAGHVAYRPVLDWEANAAAFNARLAALGDWNTTGRSYHHDGTNDLVRLRWIIPGSAWGNEAGFLRFLDDPRGRQILRWLLQTAPLDEGETQEMYEQREGWSFWGARLRRIWTTEELLQRLQKVGVGSDPSSRDRLLEILRFLALQDYVLQWGEERWTSGPELGAVHDLGSTLEWLVLAHLRHHYGALARRRVQFTQWEALKLNDLDILAFTNDLVIIAECKSGINIQPAEVAHFVQRAQNFPADLALFLIDTSHSKYVRKYARKMLQVLGEAPPAAQEYDWQEEGLLLFLPPNIYVANTATSIKGMLDRILDLGLQRKRTSL
jgi:hypothetical protein